MPLGAWDLYMDVLIQAPSESYIQGLKSATDCQEWQPVIDGPSGKLQFRLVSLCVYRPQFLMGLLPVKSRFNIFTSWEQQSINSTVKDAELSRIASMRN